MRPGLVEPIIVVGTHRSGTTFLGDVMGRHPEVAYWEEPRHVWVWGNASTPDDVLTADHATRKVADHIRDAFAGFVRAHGGSRFAEKTPSNCLRLGFIDAVFPDARYVHIYRDGRAVVRSTIQMLDTNRAPNKRQILERVRQTPVREWPALAARGWRGVGQRLLGRSMSFWGPRPPGWKAWLSDDAPREVMLAKQWAGTIAPVLEFRDRVDPDRWIDISYEALVDEPVPTIRGALEHLHLPPSDEVDSFLRARADRSRQDRWREELSADLLERIRPAVEPTLARLGYAW